MSTEYEVKFLDIDVDEIKKKLKQMGATLVHDKIKYTRYAYLLCESKIPGYFRVRDEGGNVTMTIKTYENKDFPMEYELNTKNTFNECVEFANALGIKQTAYQESFREKYKHELVHELVLDSLPGIPTYLEIDCSSKDNLDKVIEILNLDKTKMRTGAFDKTYEEYYGIERDTINTKTPSLTFANIINEIKPKKNFELLKLVAKEQQKLVKNLNRNTGKKNININKLSSKKNRNKLYLIGSKKLSKKSSSKRSRSKKNKKKLSVRIKK